MGRIRPRLGFGRGVAATLETLPGTGQKDRGATLRCPRVPGQAERDPRLPGEERDLVPRNSLQDGLDCGPAGEPAGGAAGVGILGFPRGEGEGGGRRAEGGCVCVCVCSCLEQIVGFLSVTPDAEITAGSACALRDCVGGPRGTDDRTTRRVVSAPQARQPQLSPQGMFTNRFSPADSKIVRCELTAAPLAGPLPGLPVLPTRSELDAPLARRVFCLGQVTS